MDQILIGKFIAQERKRKGYTQKQLSEKLGISDKTISKWETGNGFPEVSLLLPLCSELDITVNELLSGERVSEEDYRRKAEENMVNLVKEAQDLIVIGLFVIVIGIAIACILDRDAGAFECPECKSRFVPEMGAYIMGPHTITKRKLVCPHCGAHKYCKKVLTK